MMETTQLLSAVAKRLTIAERLELIDQLLDSLDQPDPATDALWIQEAEQRLEAYRRGEATPAPLEGVIAKHHL
ncbi:MAG TPA: addiction module protein [Rhodocyclaceae bacterium]|nr:addiction module protein [Rhodocyclaceae bacterium]